MAVEVKTKLRDSDIDEHIECMEKIREYMQAHGDKRKLIGAVAGGIVSKSALRYAQKKGFYVITQSGSAVEIAKAPENFQPKIW